MLSQTRLRKLDFGRSLPSRSFRHVSFRQKAPHEQRELEGSGALPLALEEEPLTRLIQGSE